MLRIDYRSSKDGTVKYQHCGGFRWASGNGICPFLQLPTDYDIKTAFWRRIESGKPFSLLSSLKCSEIDKLIHLLNWQSVDLFQWSLERWSLEWCVRTDLFSERNHNVLDGVMFHWQSGSGNGFVVGFPHGHYSVGFPLRMRMAANGVHNLIAP